jgi:hypothetical protein
VLRIGSIGGRLKHFLGIVVLGESSKKGSTRKYTENWVTSWRTLFWGNSGF